MRWMPRVGWLLLGLLAACGGGQGEPPLAIDSAPQAQTASAATGLMPPLATANPAQAVSSLRARARALAANTDSPETSAEQLLALAEAQFPQFFPGPQATQRLDPFRFRHYPPTGTYIGVVVQANLGYEHLGVYVMGGAFGAEPLFVGPLADFIGSPGTSSVRIETQPEDQVVTAGRAVEFKVLAAGTGLLAYQWFRDGVALPGATSDRFGLQAAGVADRGLYSVEVRDATGQATTSNRVALIVQTSTATPPAIDTIVRREACSACHTLNARLVGPSWVQIADKYAGQAGQEASLVQKVRQGGSGVWGAIPMPASTISEADALAVVRWLIGGVEGASTPVSATGLVSSAVVGLGGSVQWRVDATGTPPFSYQWRREGVDIPGATGNTLALGPMTLDDDERTFSVVVRNIAGSVRLNTVLRVSDPANYPDQTITLVVPSAAGTGLDITARAWATLLNETPGVRAEVANVTGTRGLAAIDRVLSSPAIGYSVLVADTRMATLPALYPDRQLDPLRDLVPLGLLGRTPYLLAGGAHLPAGGLDALTGWWRSRSTPPVFGHIAAGDLSQLCALLVTDRLGLARTLRSYTGSAPLMTDLSARSTDLACLPPASFDTQVPRGQARAYALTGTEPSVLTSMAGVGMLANSGLPGFDLTDWHGVYVRQGTSPVVLQRLQQALASARAETYFQRQLTQRGMNPAAGAVTTPEGHRALLEAELGAWRALIEKHGVKGD